MALIIFSVLGAATLLAHPAQSHFLVAYPPSRSFSRSRYGGGSRSELGDDLFDATPWSYNAGGVVAVRKRQEEKVPQSALDKYDAGEGGEWWPVLNIERAPNGNMIEPNEIAQRAHICGDPALSSPSYHIPYSIASDNFDVLATFQSGQIIEIDAVINAYHWGHMEVSICDTGDSEHIDNGVPTQECFNKYPLTRASDDGSASPIDSNYPGRYYVDPPCRGLTGETDQTFEHDMPQLSGPDPFKIKMRYELPPGLSCDHCVLQTKYFTAHVCRYPGYDEFDPPSFPSSCAPDKEDWFYEQPNPENCGSQPRAYPEEFWQCSDLSIGSSGRDDKEDEPVEEEPVAEEEEGDDYVPEDEEEGDDYVPEDEEEGDDYVPEEGDDYVPEDGDDGDDYVVEEEEEEKEYSFIYHGCVADDRADRVMDRMILPNELSSKMTGELCMDICEGEYKFSGTQFGRECWCGKEDTDHLLHGESEDCDYPCTGDRNETCGGFNAMEIREFV